MTNLLIDPRRREELSSTTENGCPRCLAFGHLGQHNAPSSVSCAFHRVPKRGELKLSRKTCGRTSEALPPTLDSGHRPQPTFLRTRDRFRPRFPLITRAAIPRKPRHACPKQPTLFLLNPQKGNPPPFCVNHQQKAKDFHSSESLSFSPSPNHRPIQTKGQVPCTAKSSSGW
jgi:hypothetical protein